MSDASTAHIDILREIAHNKADIEVAIADMRDTVILTRAMIEQTHKLLRASLGK